MAEAPSTTSTDAPPIWLPNHEQIAVEHAAIPTPARVDGYRSLDHLASALLGNRWKTATTVATAIAAVALASMAPSLVRGGFGGALKMLIYQGWTIGLLMAATFRFRTTTLGTVIRYWLVGALGATALVSALGSVTGGLHARSEVWVTPLLETVVLAAPLIAAVVLGQRLWRHPGLADLMVLGFAVGGGYAFVEESLWSRAAVSGFELNLGFFVPSIFQPDGQFVVGQAVWTSLVGLVIGLIILHRRNPFALGAAAVTAVGVVADRAATNDGQGTLDSVRQTLFDGRLTGLAFVIGVAAAVALDYRRSVSTSARDHLFPDDRWRQPTPDGVGGDLLDAWRIGRYRRARNGVHNTVDASAVQWPPSTQGRSATTGGVAPVAELAQLGRSAAIAVGPTSSDTGWVGDPGSPSGYRFFGPNGLTAYTVNEDQAEISTVGVRQGATGVTRFSRPAEFSQYLALTVVAVALFVAVRLLTAGALESEVTLFGLPHATATPPLVRGVLGGLAAAVALHGSRPAQPGPAWSVGPADDVAGHYEQLTEYEV